MLPNNKNIILAAQQCVDLVEDKKVVVLQAKTVPQGISAMIAMNPDGEEAEEHRRHGGGHGAGHHHGDYVRGPGLLL